MFAISVEALVFRVGASGLRQMLKQLHYVVMTKKPEISIIGHVLNHSPVLPTPDSSLSESGNAGELRLAHPVLPPDVGYVGWSENAKMTAYGLMIDVLGLVVQVRKVAGAAGAERDTDGEGHGRVSRPPHEVVVGPFGGDRGRAALAAPELVIRHRLASCVAVDGHLAAAPAGRGNGII